MAHASAPKLAYGFPTPGPQDPTSNDIMDHVFFLDKAQWKTTREVEKYDIIIVGTGFCGLGVVHGALKNDPTLKILMVDRGTFFLPEHFQNLPSPTAQTLGGMSETFPWTLDARTANGKDGVVTWQHGMLNFFGGRSTTWSAWCPRPNEDELDGWPDVLKDAARNNFSAAEKLLNVQSVDKVDSGYSDDVVCMINDSCKRPVYRALQKAIQTRLEDGHEGGHLSTPGIYRTEPAPIASRSDTGVDFMKFSTVGPLLELLMKYENLHIATNVTVKRILRQGMQATALETSRGILPIGEAKLVLAMGALPPTTLVQNSFPELKHIGKRFASHFITSIVARVPREVLESGGDNFASLEVGAMYVAGVADNDYKKQYHIQLSALYDKSPEENSNRAMRYMPDVVATASPEQIRSSEGYVIFVCAVLGELDYRVQTNTFLANSEDPDMTTNSRLRVVSNGATDTATWGGMDDATFTTLEWLAGAGGSSKNKLQYWRDGHGWTETRPTIKERRVNAMVHESSTLHAGHEENAPVDPSDYKLKGTDNVYITGAGLWPQGGSWNPTMTMTGLAIDLGKKITPPSKRVIDSQANGTVSPPNKKKRYD